MTILVCYHSCSFRENRSAEYPLVLNVLFRAEIPSKNVRSSVFAIAANTKYLPSKLFARVPVSKSRADHDLITVS